MNTTTEQATSPAEALANAIRSAVISERIACAKIAAKHCQCRIHFDAALHHFAECEAAQSIMLREENEQVFS